LNRLKKVLLVDDDEIVNSINKVIIQHANFAEEVLTETLAIEAIDLIKKTSQENLPELIFLDVNMPEMDGWDFLDEFSKAGFDGSHPKIIMLTSSINPRDEQRANEAKQVTAFLSKPLSPELLGAISKKFFYVS